MSNPYPTVLMITQDLGALGGAEQQARRLAQGLRQRQVSVELVTGCWRGRKPGTKIVDGIPVHYVSSAWRFSDQRGGWRLSQYVLSCSLFHFFWRYRHRYQILHFHAVDFLAIAGILFGHLSRRPVIIKMRASGPWSDLQYIRRLWRGPEPAVVVSLLRGADRVISLNEESTQELLAAGFQNNQIVPMVNGIAAEAFAPRTDYSLRQTPSLVFAGRLEPQKGVETLLQALALLEQPQLQALIVGDGPQRQHLEALAHSLGLKKRVIFCGRVDPVTPFLEQADLFVLPSVAEGISNTLLEAMACGLPCIATDIPGNRAVISDGQEGQLFSPGEAQTLARLLRRMLADEGLRRRLGQAAREKVLRHFAINTVVDKYLALYCQLAGTHEISTGHEQTVAR